LTWGARGRIGVDVENTCCARRNNRRTLGLTPRGGGGGGGGGGRGFVVIGAESSARRWQTSSPRRMETTNVLDRGPWVTTGVSSSPALAGVPDQPSRPCSRVAKDTSREFRRVTHSDGGRSTRGGSRSPHTRRAVRIGTASTAGPSHGGIARRTADMLGNATRCTRCGCRPQFSADSTIPRRGGEGGPRGRGGRPRWASPWRRKFMPNTEVPRQRGDGQAGHGVGADGVIGRRRRRVMRGFWAEWKSRSASSSRGADGAPRTRPRRVERS